MFSRNAADKTRCNGRHLLGEDCNQKKASQMKNNKKYLIGGIICIILLWAISWVLISIFINESGARGQFGDMFGAVNSLFSGLALCGVVYTIFLQYKANEASEHQFRFNYLVDTIYKQAQIFNDRINEFRFRSLSTSKDEMNFNKAIEYYKEIKVYELKASEFIKINNSEISSVIAFVFHTNKFVFDLINEESIADLDKEKLKKLYGRSQNRNIIDFYSLNRDSLKQAKEELQNSTSEIKEIQKEIFKLRTSMFRSILEDKY